LEAGPVGRGGVGDVEVEHLAAIERQPGFAGAGRGFRG
jgi:hypothetical protein